MKQRQRASGIFFDQPFLIMPMNWKVDVVLIDRHYQRQDAIDIQGKAISLGEG